MSPEPSDPHASYVDRLLAGVRLPRRYEDYDLGAARHRAEEKILARHRGEPLSERQQRISDYEARPRTEETQ